MALPRMMIEGCFLVVVVISLVVILFASAMFAWESALDSDAELDQIIRK